MNRWAGFEANLALLALLPFATITDARSRRSFGQPFTLGYLPRTAPERERRTGWRRTGRGVGNALKGQDSVLLIATQLPLGHRYNRVHRVLLKVSAAIVAWP
jgi:hypothetical protein